ncbi:hypothetical protein SDJN02_06676, partial [Cucurbita argyrosperma subsp. argyrosperma]
MLTKRLVGLLAKTFCGTDKMHQFFYAAGPKPGTKEEGGVIRPLELQRVLNCSCQYFHFSSSNKDGSVAIDGSNHILLKLSHHLRSKVLY